MSKINRNPKKVQEFEKPDMIDFVKQNIIHLPIVLALLFSPLLVPLLVSDLFPDISMTFCLLLTFFLATISAIISHYFLKDKIEESDYVLQFAGILIVGFLSTCIFMSRSSYKIKDAADNTETIEQYESQDSIGVNNNKSNIEEKNHNNLGRILGLPIDL